MSLTHNTKNQSDSDLTLQVLGNALLERANGHPESTTLLGPGKPLALILYLLESPRLSAERDYLTELLWSDRSTPSAQHALRQTAWHINKRVGSTLITTRDRLTRLTTEIASDLAEFRNALDAGDYQAAVDLYQGDLMPNIGLPGGGEFEKWLDGERRRAGGQFFRAADAVIRTHLAGGRFRDAEELARRWKDSDELNETAWRRLIEVLVSAGDGVLAAHAADEFEMMLQTECRVPEAASRTVIDTARTVISPKPQAVPDGFFVEMVGREMQFRRTIQAWEDARAAKARHVHIVAPPGFGKTRFLGDIASRLQAIGCPCAIVTSNQGDRDIAYALASEIAGTVGTMNGARAVAPATAGILVDLNASLSSAYSAAAINHSEEKLRRRSEALSELVRVVADERPFALLIDDLHWSDAESDAIVQRLVTSLRDARVLVVTTARPTASCHPQGPTTIRLELGALDSEQTALLLNSVATLPSETWAEQLPALLQHSTDGSPLLIVETLHLARHRQLLVIEDDTWVCPDFDMLLRELSKQGALVTRLKEVGEAERRILLVTAIAGVPLTTTVVADSLPAPIDDPKTSLDKLERQGLLARVVDGWTVTHDEVASVAVREAAPEQVTAAHGLLGRALAKTKAANTRWMQRSAVHLLEAEDWPALRELLIAWVRHRRKKGYKGALRRLAGELLAGHTNASFATRLLASTPLSFRMRHARHAVSVAFSLGVLTVLTASAAFVIGQQNDKDRVQLTVWDTAEDNHTVDILNVRVSATNPSSPIKLARRWSTKTLELGFRPSNIAAAPTGNMWAAVGTIRGDTGGVDIVVASAKEKTRRITMNSSHDDAPSFSPDGKFLAFHTTRWTNQAQYDIAIADLTTGEIRPLVRSPLTEMHPEWSPDGTRIAFFRTAEAGEQFSCWTTIDGIEERCVGPRDGNAAFSNLGWADLNHRIVSVEQLGASTLAELDVRTGDIAVVSASPIPFGSLSPDRTKFLTYARPNGYAQRAWFIGSIDRPDAIRQLRFGELRPDQFTVEWGGSAQPLPYLATLSTTRPQRILSRGAPYQLKAIGRDQNNNEFPLIHMRWSSSDSTVATVDTSGVVWPRSIGKTIITASAGGWRHDTTSIIFAETAPSTVVTESWEGEIGQTWAVYGHPRPYTTTAPGGVRAFLNNGDTSFPSGAYTNSLFAASRGLGVEARISAPTSVHRGFQQVELTITSSLDSVALRAWDHTTGDPPTVDGDFNSCTFIYPRPGPITSDRRAVVIAAGQRAIVDVDARLIAGEWVPVLLQVLPDGTCGIAIDGRLIWHSREQLRIDEAMRVVLEGVSVDTKMLIGPLEVWQGVKPGLDWHIR